MPTAPVDTIRVQAILVADSQGRGAPTWTPEQIAQSLESASRVYAPACIQFTFDPASDIERVKNDLLYNDCTVSPLADLNAPETVPPECDSTPNNDERNRIAQFYPGKLVVYFSVGLKPSYDKTAGKWILAPRGMNWSNHLDSFVMMNPLPNPSLPHEIGHYLHLVHSMALWPRCLTDQITADGKPALGPDGNPICLTSPVVGGKPVLGPDGKPELGAITLIRDYVVNNHLTKAEGVNLFEIDKDICRDNPTILCIGDTPPDPGPYIFLEAGLDPYDPNQGTISFDVPYADGPFTYTFTPARDNVMNYWDKAKLGKESLTPDQVAGVRAAITTMNRQHLIAKKVLYTAIWEPGDRGTSRAIGWTFSDFPTRFNQEIAAGKHLVHMQAYDIGGGQIRYDGVWENGGANGTTRAISWAQQDFATRFNQEIAAGKHLVHMQAYDIGGGQIRYDGVWEDGPRGTDLVQGWAFNDLVRHLEQETAAGRRLVHLQAYDIGDGQLRYDGVWEDNTSGLSQTRILAETIYPFAVRFNHETQQGSHLLLMQTVVGR